ncbi:DNA-directed RNA polymerase subunit D [Giardia muris]|uniref:DNA-directed RNA polymerases I and III subunit RPAC1 n=1 Tax=Giardia muris TaxID=5742 RepID=A0A4Z1T8U3_GIAMU|nr:DNA-directed RNA polymerase subunit D [Giardia muris]|eukprot:TNJ28931.1 DNA-directed RNA polymerase subunit D [Giardia muris]
MAAILGPQNIRTRILEDQDVVRDLDHFRDITSVVIREDTHARFQVDLIGLSPIIANTIRRIILDDVPTMAIDTVVMYENTSIIPDEVLSHRLGLVPINVDPRLFEYHKDTETITERNAIVFQLKITAPMATTASAKLDLTQRWFHVYSRDLKWVPIGTQPTWLTDVMPLDPDILLLKLAPGQTVDCELYCHKGIGRTHAKFQPAATAWYTMKPRIKLFSKALLADTDFETLKRRLHTICPVGIFTGINTLEDIEEFDYKVNVDHCTLCRECINAFVQPDKEPGVQVELIKSHLRFTIESCSWYSAKDIFYEALTVMQQKAALLKASLNNETLVEE